MVKLKQIQKSQPDFNTTMEYNELSILSRLNCHNIGKILEFDPTTQTATIQIMQVKQFDNNYYNPAPLVGVPLIIYGAGGGHITLPDPTGTICLLLFMDRNIDAFLETGESYVPDTTRMHDFTDCIALTTFKTLANPLPDYDIDAITIRNQNSKIKVKDEISIEAKSTIQESSPTNIILDAPDVSTTGNLSVATGYTGIIAAGMVSIQVTNGIITGVE